MPAPPELAAVFLALVDLVPALVRDLPWTPFAFASYLVNVTLGVLAMRGRRLGRRWHHRWFVLTGIFTAVAAVLSLPAHPWRGGFLLLALVPLLLLPRLTAPVSKHPMRHALVSSAALPSYLTALVLWIIALR